MTQQAEKKRSNTNILLFVFVTLFLALGFRGEFFRQVKTNLYVLKTELYYGNIESISSFISKTDNLTTEKLRYHDQMLDLDSAKENLLGTRVVFTEDATVVKADSGVLIGNLEEEASQKAIQRKINYIEQINKIADDNGAKFLCCPVPIKANYETPPPNVINESRQNYENLIKELRTRKIPCLDFTDAFRKHGILDEDLFFRTDHHWKPTTGFAAYSIICEELNMLYGFPINRDYTNIGNFQVETLKNWSLGSYGKKVGRFFTWGGADDFEIITPNFPTDFTEEIAGWDFIRTGSFAETMLYSNNLKKDYYHVINYVTYSGGDSHLQVIRNNKNPDDPIIAVIRTSYACVVTPFLALQTGELHVIDDRDASYVFGDPINVQEYISEIKPDFVIVLKAF